MDTLITERHLIAQAMPVAAVNTISHRLGLAAHGSRLSCPTGLGRCQPCRARSVLHRITVLCSGELSTSMKDERKKCIADSIRGVPDFPKKGIIFHDITTLLLDPKVSRSASPRRYSIIT